MIMDRKLLWPLLIVALALMALYGYCYSVKTADRLARDAGAEISGSLEKSIGLVRGLADRFRSESITETFRGAIPEIESAGSGRLEVATATVTESFERSDEQWVLWGLLSLGSTVSQIHVPVTYRYHVELADPWRIEVSGPTCLVFAPPIRPSQPPTIHTDRMEKRSQSDWTLMNGEDQLEKLEQSITPILRSYAEDPRHLNLVKDKSRLTISKFIKNWLLREDQWREDRFRRVVVFFPDEVLHLEQPLEIESQ